ncbi:MAG TPA: multicopper oxidase family protein [Chromatiales bacterium]|nr:multicopper oxidase family protein [Chromatiales bacterium]
MPIRRRDFVKLLAAGAALGPHALARAARGMGMGGAGGATGGTLTVPVFQIPLPVPPELAPSGTVNGKPLYEIVQREADVEIIPGTTTRIWGYNGITPGPTLRVRRGDPVVVRQTNLLPDNVTTHLHGGHVPPQYDGYPVDYIVPGASKDYHYPNTQAGAMLWYHDHTMDLTGRHVWMGLAGLYIIEEPGEDTLGLPSGPYEVPLVIQDRNFAADGSLVYTDNIMQGELGSIILVNGAPWPYLEVGTRKYRLRILNGSNARLYELALSNGAPFIQIGTDGGFLEQPVQRTRIRLAPAERVDVIVDFSSASVGDSIVLQNRAATGAVSQIMRFDVTRAEADIGPVPQFLFPVERLDPAAATSTRTFVFSMGGGMRTPWVINGLPYDPNRIDARPILGSTEIWELVNRSGMFHPVHIHDIMWQIVDVNGRPPAPGEAGWKDTFYVPPRGRVRVIGRFENYRGGPYVFHCHILEHEDHAMMAQFEVI